jgi:phospholipid-binding lipoprotein MlaA
MGTLGRMRRAVFVLGFAAACAAPSAAFAQAESGDPWEGFNRDMFAVHESVDRGVLEPVARAYRAVTPHPVRQGVVNFLRNLRTPVTFVNNLLQGDLGGAGVSAVRFGVNSTIGIGGVFDPAESMGLERRDEDFGQTLAVWGVGAGPYVFVPVLGPTNLRDGAGRIIDIAFDPLSWSEFDNEDTVRVSRAVITGVAGREQALDAVDNIRQNSFDPYVTMRTSYELLRESAINNGPAEVQDLPEFEEIPSDAAPPAPTANQPPAGGVKTQPGEKP